MCAAVTVMHLLTPIYLISYQTLWPPLWGQPLHITAFPLPPLSQACVTTTASHRPPQASSPLHGSLFFNIKIIMSFPHWEFFCSPQHNDQIHHILSRTGALCMLPSHPHQVGPRCSPPGCALLHLTPVFSSSEPYPFLPCNLYISASAFSQASPGTVSEHSTFFMSLSL